MNKIYKVIFNKTKGVYEVVSELAHCHSKIHSKKAALARIMAVFMGLSSFMGYTMNVVYATDTYKYLNGTLDDLKNGTFPLLTGKTSNWAPTGVLEYKDGHFYFSSTTTFGGGDNENYIHVTSYLDLGEAPFGGGSSGGSGTVDGDQSVSGNQNINGSSTINGNQNVGGTTTTNNLTVNNDANTKNLNVSGNTNLHNTTITGDANVTGTTTTNNLNVNNDTNTKNLNVSGDTNLHNTTITGDANVTGTTTTKELHVTDNASIDGDTNIGGNTTINKDLTVNGNTETKGNNLVGGNQTVNGDSDVKGNSHVGKDLTVDGTSTLNGDVAMNGNASVAKDLTVSGNTNLKDTVVDGTFKATGDAAFGSDIDVAGNGHIGKDLTVDGTSTLNGDVAMKGNASIDKDLSVSGTTNLKDTVIDGTLETTGNAVFNANTDVKGNSHIGKNLTVEGTSDLKGDVSMGSNALIKKNLGVGGNAYIDGDLYVHGYNYIDSQGINANDFRIRNVADGAILPGSTDAINGGQLYNTRVDLTNKIERVGAGAAALAGLHPGEYDPDNKLDFAAGYGHYKGANAGAIGVFYHPNEDTTVSLSGTMGNGDPMLSAGVSFKLGPSGTNTMSRTALTRQIKEDRKIMKAMADELAAMKAKMNQVLNLIDMSKKAAFPDVPEDHWAKDAVDTLHGNGSLKGYPDGKFHGDQAMTRYEYAQMLFEAIKKGAHVDQNTLNEYSSELAQIKANQK